MADVQKWPSQATGSNKLNNQPGGTSVGGTNTKGQTGKPKTGPWFQYGSKYGYMNPQGKIKYGVKGPGKGWQGNFVPQKKWQQASWDQGKSVPVDAVDIPSTADPEFLSAYRALQAQFREEQAQRLYNLKDLRQQAAQSKRQLGKSRTQAFEGFMGNMGSQGLVDSGIASKGTADIQENYQQMLSEAMRRFGPKAQRLEKTMLALAAQRFQELSKAEAAIADQRWLTENPEGVVKVRNKKNKKGK